MFRKILWSKFAFWSLFALLVQQLIVASSTFWITHLSEAVVSGNGVVLYLGLLVASLFVVYIPVIISTYNLEKAKSQAIFKYTQEFSATHSCIPSQLNDHDFQENKEPWLTNESSRTIEEAYFVVYDATSVGLNTTLNIGALCLAIDPRMLIGYLISFGMLPLISKYFKSRLEQVALTLQNDRKDMSQTLLSGWDNIIIGNIYNYSIWWKQFKARWGAYNQSSANAALFTSLASTGAMICALMPVAVTFIWLFMTTSSMTKLAALIATLPRQIQIVQHFQILTSYTMHWHGTFARLKALIDSLSFKPRELSSYLDRIKFNEIEFKIDNQPNNISSYSQLLDIVNKMQAGRITIRGKNGSGKTTLVNVLKQELKEVVYYLPTNSKLFFETTLEANYSTGQRVRACLEEVGQRYYNNPCQSVPKVLLLDEWDANLDLKNIGTISSILDEYANHFCIIEISHRQGSTAKSFDQSSFQVEQQ